MHTIVPKPGWLTVLVASLWLAACGGGGGGTPAAPQAVVEIRVSDRYGAPVVGALVQGPDGSSTTGPQGTAVVVIVPGASANVTVSRDSFEPVTVTVTGVAGQVATAPVTLDRVTSAAGGSLASRSGAAPTLDSSGQWLSFEVELVVVDGQAEVIESLTGADFALRACTPDATTEHFDCVRGSVPADDVAYTPAAAVPEAWALVPGAAPQPYATAVLLDQSGSILQSDPTGARLYASKAFLEGLGGQDQALLAAFASDAGALLPTVPLTVYGPFRDASEAPGYFATLDTLTTLVGGSTPLYESMDTLRAQWLGGGPRGDGLGKALVVFTDGADTRCGDQEACRMRREQSILGAQQDQVRLFMIGLSSGVDVAALGELANRTGGALLFADNAAQLVPLYGSVGRLMSLSLPTYRLRWTVRADTLAGFRSGQALLGRVQVTAAGSSFDVPFVVGIP